jgi:hypothetical protein
VRISQQLHHRTRHLDSVERDISSSEVIISADTDVDTLVLDAETVTATALHRRRVQFDSCIVRHLCEVLETLDHHTSECFEVALVDSDNVLLVVQ